MSASALSNAATTASTKATYGSILGAVNNTAKSVSGIFSVVNDSIGMLEKFVSKAAYEQQVSHTKARHTFIEKTTREYAMEEAEAGLEVAKYCNQSAVHKSLFETNYVEMSEVLAKYKQN